MTKKGKPHGEEATQSDRRSEKTEEGLEGGERAALCKGGRGRPFYRTRERFPYGESKKTEYTVEHDKGKKHPDHLPSDE